MEQQYLNLYRGIAPIQFSGNEVHLPIHNRETLAATVRVSRQYRGPVFEMVQPKNLQDATYLFIVSGLLGNRNTAFKNITWKFIQQYNSCEIFSKHFMLKNLNEIVICAGELQKRSGIIIYNFFSGTYMQRQNIGLFGVAATMGIERSKFENDLRNLVERIIWAETPNLRYEPRPLMDACSSQNNKNSALYEASKSGLIHQVYNQKLINFMIARARRLKNRQGRKLQQKGGLKFNRPPSALPTQRIPGFRKGGLISEANRYVLHKGEKVIPYSRVKQVENLLRAFKLQPLKKECKECYRIKTSNKYKGENAYKGGKIHKASVFRLKKGDIVIPAYRVKTIDNVLKAHGLKKL